MPITEKFSGHFSTLTDPRKNNHNKRHLLSDILVLIILAVICGADDWVAVEEFDKEKRDWLKTFLKLQNS